MSVVDSFGSPEWEGTASRFEASLTNSHDGDACCGEHTEEQAVFDRMVESFGTPAWGEQAAQLQSNLEHARASLRRQHVAISSLAETGRRFIDWQEDSNGVVINETQWYRRPVAASVPAGVAAGATKASARAAFRESGAF